MILAGAQLVRAALGPVSQLLSITGNHYASLFVSMFATALMFGLNHLLIPQFGLEGAAYTVLAVMSLEALLLSFVVKKRLGINASVFGIFKLIK
jgi:O-antigen/teichoic acid export membrane protein